MGGTTAGAPSATPGGTPGGIPSSMMSSMLNKALSHSGARMTNVGSDPGGQTNQANPGAQTGYGAGMNRPNPFQFNSPFNQSAIGDPRNFGMGGGYGGPAGYGMPNPFQRPGMPPGGFARPAIPSYGNPGGMPNQMRNAALPNTPQQGTEAWARAQAARHNAGRGGYGMGSAYQRPDGTWGVAV